MKNEERQIEVNRQKRNTLDHEDSFELEENPHKKGNREITNENNIDNREMDEIKEMLREMKKDIRDLRHELLTNNEEMRIMKEKIVNETGVERRKTRTEKGTRLVRLEKDKIKNNIVISGLNIEGKDNNLIKQNVEEMLIKESRVKKELKSKNGAGREGNEKIWNTNIGPTRG
ncbi:unnamed protein product [Brassicogethes aeneus]|uniref:Uncharacterized protein n=1 Tax=Brassicogethes aeneus TaxID=1431903 RepID=A0A9P0FK93_BRAAE|nr:unnamed protein product [Brassicogethes aeneus]